MSYQPKTYFGYLKELYLVWKWRRTFIKFLGVLDPNGAIDATMIQLLEQYAKAKLEEYKAESQEAHRYWKIKRAEQYVVEHHR